MTIRRLDVFFRTELTLDQPQFFNSITNCALAPLQHLVGQNQFQSLQGKVSYVSQTTEVSSCYIETLFKVVVFVCDFFVAIVLTPIGIAARFMSFRSPQIDQAYSVAFLLQLSPFERTPELMESSFAFIRKMPEPECTKFLNNLPAVLSRSFHSLPAHRDITNAFLPSVRIELLKTLPAPAQGSFLSLAVNAEFSKKYVLEKTEAEYNQLMPYLPANLIEMYQAQKAENTKKKSLDDSLLDDSLLIAIQSLEKLEKLKANGAQDPKVNEFRSDPLYSFPFYLAQQLEIHSKIVARADKTLWERLLSLRKSCLAFLPSDCDDALLKTTQAQAKKTFDATFISNMKFFKELLGMGESNMETADIKAWIEGKKREQNYSYPFYTQPHILKLLSQTATAENFRRVFDIFSSCSTLLFEKGLQEYISEKPDSDHAAVNALLDAMDQLENISNYSD